MTTDLASKATDGEFRVLRAGEEKELPGGRFYAPATISAIHELKRDGVFVYRYQIIDAGGIGENIINEHNILQREVHVGEVDYVFITHNHPDHVGNIARFKNAYIHMPDSHFHVRKPNEFGLMPEDFMSKPGNKMSASRNPRVKLISTPGHSGWDMSVLYTGKDARVLACGDLFWSEDDFRNDTSYLGLCVNKDMQERSRDYIRNQLKPDVIIPGHGPAFMSEGQE
jgi:glyoxylase-like metal-dependent hydrolase (beta-lactamase superfamily II)